MAATTLDAATPVGPATAVEPPRRRAPVRGERNGDGDGRPVAPQPRRSITAADRRWRAVMTLWAVMLYGYALFDKGFAYLHIPGTPLFIGELALVPVAVLVAVDTRWFHGHRLLPFAVLGAYCTWALVRLAESLPTYRLDALRDSAMWYYAAVAALVVAWFHRSGPAVAFEACIRFAERLMVPLLLWSPVAVLAERAGGTTVGPVLPFTGISVLTHKPSNLAPLLTLIALYAWHDEHSGFSHRRRVVLFTWALIDIAAVGTQTRGGFLAALFGMTVGTLVLPRRQRVRSIARRGIAICLAFFVVAFALDLKVSAGRDLGVRQLTNNTLSVVGLNAEDRNDPVRGTLEGNAEWRERLWAAVISKTFLHEHEVSGWGFGPNLGDELGFENQLGDGSLRSPHNSHLSVFGRLGAIGLVLWLTLWGVWAMSLAALARRRDCSDDRVRVAAAILIGMMVSLHINAYFDPAYESPQAGAWLWAVFGAGCGLLLLRREVVPAPSLTAYALRPRWPSNRLVRWFGLGPA
ncbi:MAG: O-antigen ligase family protein [Acidimicrobiales bacterium]|nr:O-antigen ligase family protein [Acidimicrobiales bacterium]